MIADGGAWAPAGFRAGPSLDGKGRTTRKQAVGAAFGRAAAAYDQHGALQRAVAADLASRIATLDLPAAPFMLEIGCGTGFLTRAVRAVLPLATGLVTDIAPAMVSACRARGGDEGFCYAVMDGEAPCVSEAGGEDGGLRGFDLICASLAVQWFDDLKLALGRLHACLRPGGWLAVATLGPRSFESWRAAHRAEGVAASAPEFPPVKTFVEAWPGPARVERRSVQVEYDSGLAFLQALRGIGAATPRAGAEVLNVGAMRRVLARFEHDAGAVARYEIVFACLRSGSSAACA